MKKPKNIYCHRLDETLPKQLLAQKGLELVDKVGEGSFGVVYKVFDPSNSKLMVIKKKKEEKGGGLTEEDEILRQMSNSQGFDTIRLQKYANQSEIYMECLGPSLGTTMRKVKKMNCYSMKRIGHQLINRLKQMHNHNFVHRDLKPDNVVLGNQNQPHQIFLIDFGLTASFRRKSTKQRKTYDGLIGTAKFCPLASHYGLEQYPKDDLQSLGYILTYLVTGELPWGSISSKNQEQLFQKIRKGKQESSLQALSGGLNCLRNYYETIKALKVGEKINYNQLAKFFEVDNDGGNFCYDFCETLRGKCYINSLKQKTNYKEIQFEGKANRIRCSILN